MSTERRCGNPRTSNEEFSPEFTPWGGGRGGDGRTLDDTCHKCFIGQATRRAQVETIDSQAGIAEKSTLVGISNAYSCFRVN